MYRFENDAYNKKLQECINEYELYRKMFIEETDFMIPEMIIRRLQKLTAFNSTVGRLKAGFDFLVDKATCIEMRKIDHDSMPAKKFDALVRDGVGLVTLYPRALDVMIKESHYQIESLRSVLSYLKTEAQYINAS
jgi:hypothetical protein